jgi:hypothetical protein
MEDRIKGLKVKEVVCDKILGLRENEGQDKNTQGNHRRKTRVFYWNGTQRQTYSSLASRSQDNG